MCFSASQPGPKHQKRQPATPSSPPLPLHSLAVVSLFPRETLSNPAARMPPFPRDSTAGSLLGRW